MDDMALALRTINLSVAIRHFNHKAIEPSNSCCSVNDCHSLCRPYADPTQTLHLFENAKKKKTLLLYVKESRPIYLQSIIKDLWSFKVSLLRTINELS